MTPTEMLNLFETLFKERQANQSGTYDVTEKEALLNIAQDKFIKTNFERFQRDQRLSDELRTLVRRNWSSDVYYLSPGSTTGYHQEENGYFFNLPHNYLHLINLRANTKIIDTSLCSTSDSINIQCTEQSGAEYIAVVPFVAPVQELCSGGDLDLQIVFKDMLNADNTRADTNIFDYAQYTRVRGYQPVRKLTKERDKYIIVNLVLEYLNRYNSFSEILNANVMGSSTFPTVGVNSVEDNNHDDYMQVYWETYNDQYYENSFVFVTKNKADVSNASASVGYESDAIYNDDVTPLGIEVDITSNGTSLISDATTLNRPLNRFSQKTRCVATLNTEGVDPQDVLNRRAPVRMENGNNIYFTLDSPIGKTTYEKPLGTMGNNMLYLFSNGNFIFETIKMDYIRKPRRISSAFNLSCELPSDVHSDIVDRAVTLALETTGNPRFQSKIAETQYREGRQ